MGQVLSAVGDGLHKIEETLGIVPPDVPDVPDASNVPVSDVDQDNQIDMSDIHMPKGASCHATPPLHRVNFSSFAPRGSNHAWPALYLLGAQKAATTSVVMALMQCGLVTGGLPSKNTGLMATCSSTGYNTPCKETLHSPINLKTAEGRARFTKLQDVSRCGHIKQAGVRAACEAGRFIEATPSGIGDSPDVATLMGAIPPQYIRGARFALICREPVRARAARTRGARRSPARRAQRTVPSHCCRVVHRSRACSPGTTTR